MGPTASGKTDLAVELAQRLDCELVSVDSALVYRGMDIGSAKPDFPHHLVDIRDPAEAYSAADFVADANRVVAQILARGRTPLLVGGTMLYFKAFLEGLAEMRGGKKLDSLWKVTCLFPVNGQACGRVELRTWCALRTGHSWRCGQCGRKYKPVKREEVEACVT